VRFAALIWKNALRNKRRSLLTILSLAASLFLLTTLRTVVFELETASMAPAQELRLITRHAYSFVNPMPMAYLERIRSVPGVREVMPGNWFAGIYIDENNFFGQWTVDQEKLFAINPELQVPEDQKAAFRKIRNGALGGRGLFERFHWKVGQNITLKGTNYPVDLELVLVGEFTSLNPPDEAGLIFRQDYLTELTGKAEVAWINILAEDRDRMPSIMSTIDDMFRNSSVPTKTETERAFQLSFSGMMGNVRLLVGSISAVVVFTILLVTAATMGMSIRERTAELGILKSLGFTRGKIIALLVGEALLIALCGWLLGCVGARLLFGNMNMLALTAGWFQVLRVQPDSLYLGLMLSVVVALLAAGIPAYRASRLSIAEALRYVG
jgi:putative ABC transport system permease protein